MYSHVVFCVVVCHVRLSYVNQSGTGIHKNRGALIYPCRLSSSFFALLALVMALHRLYSLYRMISAVVYDFWQKLAIHYRIHISISVIMFNPERFILPWRNECFFSPFPQSLIPLLPLQHFLNLDSWIQLKRHIHGSDDDRAVSQLMIGWLLKPSVWWSK